jgi:hypothetical protein
MLKIKLLLYEIYNTLKKKTILLSQIDPDITGSRDKLYSDKIFNYIFSDNLYTKFIKQNKSVKNILKKNKNYKEPEMKTYTFDEVQEKIIGKRGTVRREKFENELQMDLIGNAIKQTRRERDLTQEEPGKLLGVQKKSLPGM